MKTIIFILMILATTSLTSGEAFNNYRFPYNGREYKMSEFISELRNSMPNKQVRADFDKHIDAIIYYSLKRNLDPILVLSMVIVESGLRVTAKSNVGARGLMQVMPGTRQDIIDRILKKPEYKHMAPINPAIDFDIDAPNENIDLGTIYIVYLMDKFRGNLQKVVIAYNMGPGYLNTLPKNFNHNHLYYKKVKNVYGKINNKLVGNEKNNRAPASSNVAKL